jgi:hypothetical protein
VHDAHADAPGPE